MSIGNIIIMIVFVVCVVFQVMTMIFLIKSEYDDVEVTDKQFESIDHDIQEINTKVNLLAWRAMKEDDGKWWTEHRYRLVVGNAAAVRGSSSVHIRKHMQEGGR